MDHPSGGDGRRAVGRTTAGPLVDRATAGGASVAVGGRSSDRPAWELPQSPVARTPEQSREHPVVDSGASSKPLSAGYLTVVLALGAAR